MRRNVLFLFDVDGTLTLPRKVISAEMRGFLQKLRTEAHVGIVGGSDLAKQKEQIGDDELIRLQIFNVATELFDYVFSENGLMAFQNGNLLQTNNLKKEVGDARLALLIRRTLGLLSGLDIPVMRGTFIEFRNGMLNVSPIGRSCTQEERDEFEQYDKQHHVRQGMVDVLSKEFPDFKFSIGGQISFDVFPVGWDKTYCLRFIEGRFDSIYFFGDKTAPGGNDHEIFIDSRVKGNTVTSPEDTMRQVSAILATL